jgi:hypothetical protein
MKIEQEPEFQPITITIETADEANFLWEILEEAVLPATHKNAKREFCISLCNWFSDTAQLGGKTREGK